jgi:hypothetical protein
MSLTHAILLFLDQRPYAFLRINGHPRIRRRHIRIPADRGRGASGED